MPEYTKTSPGPPAGPGAPADEDLEKLLLLGTTGVPVDDGLLDRAAGELVTRNREAPARALRFARLRPGVDACAAVIAQFGAAPVSRSSEAAGSISSS